MVDVVIEILHEKPAGNHVILDRTCPLQWTGDLKSFTLSYY